MQQIVTAVLVRKRVPDVPDLAPAAETIRRCFAFEPCDRPTASELAEALSQEAATCTETMELELRQADLKLQNLQLQKERQELERAAEAAQIRLVEAQQQWQVAELTLQQRDEEIQALRRGQDELERAIEVTQGALRGEQTARAGVEVVNAQLYRKVDELEQIIEEMKHLAPQSDHRSFISFLHKPGV